VNAGHWNAPLLVLMPDHLHLLASFPVDKSMKRVVADWKRYTARSLGISWQRDFFDHRLRSDEEVSEKWHYVLINPVRGGLVETAEDWEYTWVAKENGGLGEPALPRQKGRAVSPKPPQQAIADKIL